ncbi:MAG: hypothetical protein ACRD3S_03170, partial [Terracidiphilus sp.]
MIAVMTAPENERPAIDPPAIDPKPFHDLEHAGWQRAAGAYHGYFGSLTSQAIGPLLDAVLGEDGQPPAPNESKLLDIAAGPGYVSAEAARRGWLV